MTTMFPLLVWQPGTLQASVPANDNALRVEVLHRGATSILSAPPVSPVDGEVYILGPAPTGAWAGFMQHDVVMWRAGTWMRFLPFQGWVKQVGAELRRFDGAAWVVVTGGGGGGVSSVALAVPAGFSVTGSPVTASGTLTISYGAGFQGFTTAESVKLAGIATSATANATDAALRDRNTHTGTQLAATISDFSAASRAQTGAMLVAGQNVSLTPSGTGAGLTITIASAGGAGGGSSVTSTVTPAPLAPTPVIGTSVEAARADHAHVRPTRAELGLDASLPPSGHVVVTGSDPYFRTDANNKGVVLSGGSGWTNTGAVFRAFGNQAPLLPGSAEIRSGEVANTSLNLIGFAHTWIDGHRIWHAGNSAQVQAGTTTGQFCRWNQTTGRYEAFDLLGTVNTWTGGQVFGGAAGSEGGEFGLQAPVTGTNLTGNVAVDIQGNSFRVFSTFNGQTRGFSMNFAGGTDNAIFDILHAGNYATANTWTGTNTYTQNVTIGDGTTTRNLTVHGATSGANSGAFVGARLGSTGFVYPGVIGNRSAIIGGAYSPQGILWSSGTGLPFDVVCVEGFTVNGSTVWHAGNSAQVQAGTTTGQFCRWNQTTGRYEAFDLFGTANLWTATQTFADTSASTLRLTAADAQSHIQIGAPGAGSAGNTLLIISKLNPTTLLITGWNGTAVDGRLNIDMPLGVNINSGVFQNNTYARFITNDGSNSTIAGIGGANAGLEAQARGTGAAVMSFHRPNAYAVHFGIDTDNQLKVGGWSLGAVAHVIWHAGNSAQVLAGTATGQIMVWNHATGRVEPAAPGEEMADWRGSLRDTPLHIRLIDYTFTINDRGTKVMKNAAGAVTYTIPTGLPQGMTLVVRNKSASGDITVARAAGVVLRIAGSGVDQNCAVAPWGEALLHHEENNEWVISGTGVT